MTIIYTRYTNFMNVLKKNYLPYSQTCSLRYSVMTIIYTRYTNLMNVLKKIIIPGHGHHLYYGFDHHCSKLGTTNWNHYFLSCLVPPDFDWGENECWKTILHFHYYCHQNQFLLSSKQFYRLRRLSGTKINRN